jgi:hypothetical protein
VQAAYTSSSSSSKQVHKRPIFPVALAALSCLRLFCCRG